jgi:hypothetical protein
MYLTYSIVAFVSATVGFFTPVAMGKYEASISADENIVLSESQAGQLPERDLSTVGLIWTAPAQNSVGPAPDSLARQHEWKQTLSLAAM